MIRLNVKSVYVNSGNDKRYTANLPATLYSVLIENGVMDEPYYRDNIQNLSDFKPGTVRFDAEVSVDAFSLSQKNVYLSVSGIVGACDLIVNGTPIGRLDRPSHTYKLDVKCALKVGHNVITFSFVEKLSDDPYSRDVGILGEVFLMAFSKKIIDRVSVEQHHGEGRVTLDISAQTIGYDEGAQLMATLISPGGSVSYTALAAGRGSVVINSPNLWWPRGMGLQNLYKLTVSLYSDGKVEDSIDIKIGLRSIETEISEERGLTLVANGVPYFAMGAVYVEEDRIKSRITPKRTRKLLEAAASAGCNLICVDPEAAYPSDTFFEVCDALGIVVWLKLHRCLGEPTEYKYSTCEKLSELCIHPSFGFASADTDTAQILLGALDRNVNLVKDAEKYCSAEAGSERGIAHGFGFESVPNKKSVASFTAPEDRNIFSYVMDKHTGGTAAGVNIVKFAAEDFLMACDFSDFSYMSDIAATRQVESTVARLRMARGHCSGVVISSLNDSRPTVSSSSIDYYGRWKAQHYRTARLFAPVLIYAVAEGTRVSFYLSNEQRSPLLATLNFSVLDSENRVVYSGSHPASLAAMSADEIYTCDFGHIVEGKERDLYLSYNVTQGLFTLSKGTLLFTKPKFFNFKDPNIQYSITGVGHEFVLDIKADAFAGFVELDFAECDAVFEENYFDIVDKGNHKISFVTSEAMSVEKLICELSVRSVYDMGLNAGSKSKSTSC